MRYRADIDGLRALAVVPVVLFHAGVYPFSGGFVGVDIFFVISGYLIASLIVTDIKRGQFSIVRFYERRVRRILPALFVVLLFSAVAAWLLLLPHQFDAFAQSLTATALFVSNVLFWREISYFAAPAIGKPLLHTWSLAVEEQFYIVFPLFLFVVHRWLKEKWAVCLLPVALGSFALSVWAVAHKPSAAFYLAPTRAWELLLGSLLAVGAIPQVKNRLWGETGGAVGLGLIAWGMFTLSDLSPFPGLNALYPAIGAALVIHSATNHETATSKLLALRPMVFVGLISYSLYLWHWPLLVFAQVAEIDRLTPWQSAVIIFLSLALAVLSWRFVELPFRRRIGVLSQRPLFAGAAVATGCMVTFGLFGHFSHGWPDRMPSEVRRLAAFRTSANPREECTSNPTRQISPRHACTYGADVTPSYVLWGDSHADTLIEMLGDLARRHGQSVAFMGMWACPPIAGTTVMGDGLCWSHNAQVLKALVHAPHLRTVILAARWSVYVEGYNTNFGPAEGRDKGGTWLTDRSESVLDLAARKKLFAEKMASTVKTLVDAGKTVAIVYPIPETGYYIPATLARLALAGRAPGTFTRPESYYSHRQRFVRRVLDALGPPEQIVRIRPNRRLCDGTRCIVYADGKPLYRDDDHLSLAGANYISDLFVPLFGKMSGRIAASQGSAADAVPPAKRRNAP